MNSKKAVFFSTDALIALIIIFLTILAIYPVLKTTRHESEVQGDIMKVLSSLKIGEIDDSYVQSLITSGQIDDLNKSLLEQIGEFYVTNVTIARALSQSILENLDTNENVGIWYGDSLLASVNSTPFETARNIETDRQIISGLSAEDGSVTGYSARAYLSSGSQRKYFYFGGYVGDGNVSANVEYNGTLEDIEVEIVASRDFTVYINGQFSGQYQNSSSVFSPAQYDLSAYIGHFNSGQNIIKFVGVGGENLYIAGGYVKILYSDSGKYEKTTKYFFPGIEGLINLYDSFYISGQLDDLNILLHLDTAYKTFLTIGNVTVFNDSTSGEETILITDSELSSLLDYDDLSGETIPLRLGLENVSYVSNISSNADVFSVTDLSGSMQGSCSGGGFWCCLFSGDFCFSEPNCNSCGGVWDPGKIGEAKAANNLFINSLLNTSGNRVGLVGYADDAYSGYHVLSDDNDSLIAEVDTWGASGATCICCGINRAVNDLLSDSNESRFRSIVVMSDGQANRQCAEQGTGSAAQDAIDAACDAYNNYDIRVYAIGFGADADETTLQSIASCGNGSYYYSDVIELSEIYQDVAEDILQAAYNEQTIEVSGDISTILYPDSYIEFNYTAEITPLGLITTSEKLFDDDYSGSFSIPGDKQILETIVISYSGPRWTDSVLINNNSVFNLSSYGNDYTRLGDPHAVNILNPYILENNIVNVTTGIFPGISTSGSRFNKIIYTLKQNASSYSDIMATAEGCIWNLEFEDGANLTLAIPDSYSGTDNCYYQSSDYDAPGDYDAIQAAVYDLLRLLDLDQDGRIDVKFAEQNLDITSSEITGIPYSWSTEVQVRRWY